MGSLVIYVINSNKKKAAMELFKHREFAYTRLQLPLWGRNTPFTLLSLTHAARRFDPSFPSSSNVPVRNNANHKSEKGTSAGKSGGCSHAHSSGSFSLTVGNSTTLHLPINPHLSLCHGLLSAVLGLLHDSRFEGPLLRLDLVKKKDVRTRDEALLCLRRVYHGRSITPIRIWSLRVKHDLDDGCVSFLNIFRLI